MCQGDNNQGMSRNDIHETTEKLVDKLDNQKMRSIEMEMERKRTVEEYMYGISKLNGHSLCEGNVVCPKEAVKEVEKSETHASNHGEGCHCELCCPNPKPTFLQRNKNTILMTIIWIALIILGVGWTPSGATFEAMQTSFVELIVNFFKMGIFAIAGMATYHLFKKKGD